MNTNTVLVIAAIGVVGFVAYQHHKKQQAPALVAQNPAQQNQSPTLGNQVDEVAGAVGGLFDQFENVGKAFGGW